MWIVVSKSRSFWAFFTAVLLGIVLVVSLTLIKQPVFIFTATLLLMISYAFWLYLEARATGDVERCADNIYYLGFSLTLAALIAAMVSLHTSPSAAGLKDVLYQFGLGLCTTFFGLVGRIMLLQLDRSTGDVREEVDRHLEEAASRLATQLDIGVRYLSVAHSQMAETMAKHTQECGDVLATAKDLTTSQSRELGEELKALVGEIRNVRISYAGELKRISKSMVSSLEGIFSDLESRMIRVRLPAEVWEQQLREALAGIQSELKQVESVVGTLREILKSQSDSAREFAEATRSSFKDVLVILSNLATALQACEEAAKFSTLAFDEANHRLSEQSKFVARELEKIKSLREQIHAEVEFSVLDTKKVHQALVDGAKYITEKLERDGK